MMMFFPTLWFKVLQNTTLALMFNPFEWIPQARPAIKSEK